MVNSSVVHILTVDIVHPAIGGPEWIVLCMTLLIFVFLLVFVCCSLCARTRYGRWLENSNRAGEQRGLLSSDTNFKNNDNALLSDDVVWEKKASQLQNKDNFDPEEKYRTHRLRYVPTTEKPLVDISDDYNEDSSIDQRCGSVCVEILYSLPTKTLLLKIMCASDIKSSIQKTLPNVYAQITLLPDKRRVLRTQNKSKTFCPVWNEAFVFENFPQDNLRSDGVQIEIIDQTGVVGDRSVGHATLQFRDICKASVPEWQASTHYLRQKEFKPKFGKLLVSLTYISTRQKLVVGIIRACDLQITSTVNQYDPYVKMMMYNNRTKTTVQFTTVKFFTVNPQWNEFYKFGLGECTVDDIELKLKVKACSDVRINHNLGRILLSSRTSFFNSGHLTKAFLTPDCAIEQWHNLVR